MRSIQNIKSSGADKSSVSDRKILISACLTGEKCRYDGNSNPNAELIDLLEGDKLIPVCPEVEGGLPVPRPPAEIRGDRVLRENGEDVTRAFKEGARICTMKGTEVQVSLAILKSRSPACGCGQIYDGSFSGKLVDGDGIFTRSLKAEGIQCISDEDFLDTIKS